MSSPNEFFDAVKKGDLSSVKDWLAKDRNLVNVRTEKGYSPVTLAAYYGKHEVLNTLLQHRPTLTLHEASIVGDVTRVREFVEKDRKLVNDTSAPDGYSALALAAHFGKPDIVRYLLSRRADVNLEAPGSGFTALTGAVAGGHPEIVRMLIEAGADVNHRYEEQRFSPLLAAASDGDLGIVKMLVEAGADVHARTTGGRTALSMAVEGNHSGIVEYLRGRGAM